jgi:DNA polymerase-3 subunit gamma/tau
MLTNHAFNAMLKTLEEPPEHIKFILATTDPQKIPVTVLSRCLQFNLKQMPPGHIVGHLENILGQEQIAFETPALRLLAQGAHGSMRDALSLTDQAIAYAAGKVTLEAVQGMLGALDQSYLVRLLDALAARDGAALLAVADEMAARSLSYSTALQDLSVLLHRIAVAQTVPAALPEDLPERDDAMRLAAAFDPEEVQLFYQIAVHGRNELGLAPDEYAGFSMTLLRLLAFRPEPGSADARPALAAAPATPAASRPAPVSPVSAAPVRNTGGGPARAALEAARGVSRPQSGGAPAVTAAASALATNAPPWDEETLPVAVPGPAAQKKTEPLALVKSAPAAVPAAAQPAPQLEVAPAARPVAMLGWDGNWPALAAALPLRGVVQQLALQSELMSCGADPDSPGTARFKLRLPVETLRSAGSVDKLAAALSEHFGKPVKVDTEIGAVCQTANAQAQAERAERQRKAEQKMQEDPFVQSLMREFNASIVPGSIKPI